MSMTKSLYLCVTLFLLSACDEGAALAPKREADGGMMPVPDAQTAPMADAGMPPSLLIEPDAAIAPIMPDANVVPEPDMEPIADAAPVPVDPALSVPVNIEVKLTPRLSRYTIGQEVTVAAIVKNVYGDVLEGSEITWTVDPADRAMITADRMVAFQTVGSGTIKACLGELCGQAAFIADDGPPRLEITSPIRAQVFEGEDERTIVVSGQVTDGSQNVNVRVNGTPVDVAEDGRFTTMIRLNFGLNRITTEADDGDTSTDTTQPGPTTDLREVLWAPAFTPVDANGAAIETVAAVRVDQALFDTNMPVMVMEGLREFEIEGLAQLLEIILKITDISQFINPEELFGVGDGAIEIGELSLGNPEVEFNIAPPGLELFLRLPDVTIQTRGAIDLQGEQLSLNGTITIALSARIAVSVTVNDEPRLVVEVSEDGGSGVIVESIDADFGDGGLGALLTARGDSITGEIERLFGTFIDGQLKEQISGFVRDALLGLFGDLRNLPLNLDAMIPGVAPLNLVLSLFPTSLELRSNHWLRFIMKTIVSNEEPVEARMGDPGVPALTGRAWDDRSGQGIGLTLRLGLFNALMHEVWRSGLLTLTIPEEQNPLPALIESISADAKLAPVIAPAPIGSATPLQIQIGELHLYVTKPGSEPDVYSVTLRSGLDIGFANDNLSLSLDAEPDVQGQIIQKASEQPLNIALLTAAVKGLVWDSLREGLEGSLDFGLGSVAIDPAVLQGFVPNINALDALPQFNDEAAYPFGHPSLEGRLLIRLGLND